MKRNKTKRLRTVAWLIMALSLCIMLLSGFRLMETQQTYRIGDNNYKALTESVRPAGPPVFHQSNTASASPGGSGTTPLATAGGIEIPDMAIDFDALHAINPNAVAWLYSPGTVIDYPIVRATDYDYYLHRLPDGTYNSNGTLFIDYNWTDFSDKLTVVYGHNMKSGRMFGSLTNYKKQDYFEAHQYLYLYTEDGEKHRIDLLYGCVIGAGQWRDRAFMFDVNMDALLAYAEYNTTFKSKTQYNESDRIIALSTCSYEFDNARYVLLGVLQSD